MLDTAAVQVHEAAPLANVIKSESPVPRRSLDEIKATLARARTQVNSKRIKEIQDELLDIEEALRLSKMKDSSVATQIKALNLELTDHLATLDEVRAFAELLKAGGENPVEIERATVILVNEIKEKISRCGDNTKIVEAERADLGRRASALREELTRLERGEIKPAQTPTEIHRQETARQRDERNEQKQDEKLVRCRPEVQRIFKEVGALPQKLMSLPGDLNKPARTIFVQNLAAEIRHVQQAYTSLLVDDEQYLMRQSLYALCGCSKRFDLFYIDALNTRATAPRNFPTWKEYLDDARQQKTNLFSPKPEEPKKPLYGVVKPAEPAVLVPSPTPVPAPAASSLPSPKAIPNAIAEVIEEMAEEIKEPAPPIAIAKVVKKKEKEKSGKISDKILLRMIKETKILKFTKGLRAAVFANGKAMDEPLREFLEEAFGFKRLVWNDGRNDNIEISLKAKTIDVVYAHLEFNRLIGMAKKSKIPVAVISSHSKQLICSQICEHYGEKLNLELVS